MESCLTLPERSSILVNMNKLSKDKQIRVLSALVEGCSIRATVRMTGVAKNTIVKLLAEIGAACEAYQNKTLRDLPCARIQCDEIWSFCHAKEKNVPDQFKGKFGHGVVWTWVAMDSESKLVVSWLVGRRDAVYAHEFMRDVASRLSSRVQLTTDGLNSYLSAVREAFHDDIDFAQLVKLYGEASSTGEARYSPPQCMGCRRNAVSGSPDVRYISTSHIERQNLTMRMSMRRFTRLTNAFSKKIENLQYAVALHFMHYNFCRIHQTLRMTPAMACAVTDKVWSLDDVLSLLDQEKISN